jgi:hypothetical protein
VAIFGCPALYTLLGQIDQENTLMCHRSEMARDPGRHPIVLRVSLEDRRNNLFTINVHIYYKRIVLIILHVEEGIRKPRC